VNEEQKKGVFCLLVGLTLEGGVNLGERGIVREGENLISS